MLIRFFVTIFVIASSCVYAVMTQHGLLIEDYAKFAGRPQFDNVVEITVYKTGKQYTCTGTVIDSRTVLTAAHCFSDLSYSELIVAKSPAGSLGHITLVHHRQNANSNDHHHETFGILGVRLFATCFDPKTRIARVDCDDDIALVYLDRPMFRSVYPSIALHSHDALSLLNSTVEIAGFGATGTNIAIDTTPSNQKLAGTMTIDAVITQGSRSVLTSQFNLGKPEERRCAPGPGDSGAPAIVYDANNAPVIVGIVRSSSFFDGDLFKNGWGPALIYLFKDGKLSFNEFCNQPYSESNVGKKFMGHNTTRYFTHTASYGQFIEEGLAVRNIQFNSSSTNLANWSENALWSSSMSLAPYETSVIRNKHKIDQEGAAVRFYNVQINSPVYLDEDVELDHLAVNANNGYLEIPRGKGLSAYNISGLGGEFLIDGAVRSAQFTLFKGTLRGSGAMIMFTPQNWLQRFEKRQIQFGNFINDHGFIHQVSKSYEGRIYHRLLVVGGYVHKKDAHFVAGINGKGESSLFRATQPISLEGGKLLVLFENRAKSKEFLSRWTIMKSDVELRGTFDEVTIVDEANLECDFAVEYFSDHVDVVTTKAQ